MIKVERIERPDELTDAVRRQLTEEFKRDTSKRVWNKKYIREGLLKESSHKCVYCECLIGEGHKEMHVDHFHYKDKYPEEVVLWENLNPSCPRCNKNKSIHDTYQHPIINPFEQNPKDYFFIRNYRYYSRNEQVEPIVRDTIDVLGLNDTDEVVKFRFAQGEALAETIEAIYRLAKENAEILCSDTRKRNRVLRGCRNILSYGTKEAEYAAFMATIIADNPYYKKLKDLLQGLGLWDEHLQELNNTVERLKMQTFPDITT